MKNHAKTPEYLKPGDCIGIIATARSVSKEDIHPAIHLLESWGLNVILGEHLFQKDHQFAGTDIERASDFQYMLNHPSVKAILCARGGYGSIRIMEHIDFSGMESNPKWIIGYSDVTVLHAHIQSLYGIETIHACMAFDFLAHETPATESLKKVLFGEKKHFSIPPHPLNRKGKASGPLIGGNLSMLYSIRGTISDGNWENALLFIEDLDEYIYHIDRMMQNLLHGGKLEKLKGLIIGSMTDMHDNPVPFGKTAEEIIANTVNRFHFPVCFGFPAGHLKGENQAVILGREYHLTVSESETLLSY